MAALQDREYKRRSKAWDHFVKTDTTNHLAECMYCQEVLSYNSTSANLLKHLERKHNFWNQEKSPTKEKQIETEYWEHFNRNDDEKKATCKLCSEEVDFEESPTAPLDHLKNKHGDEINEIEMVVEEEASEDDGVDSDENFIVERRDSKKPRNKSSVAWNYFDVEDEDSRVARCKLCSEVRSYRSTVTNLIRHLNRKHSNYASLRAIKRECDADETAVETDAEDNTDTFASDEPKSSRRRSSIWLYFKVVNERDKRSQCLICKNIFSYSTTVSNLRQHLRRRHPHLRIPRKDDDTKTILLSANGDIFEVETDKNGDLNEDGGQHEPEEMDTVYLEDFDALESPLHKKQKYTAPRKRERNQRPLQTIKLHDSSSDDEIPIKSRKTSDSIDHFGRYAASLLRELPKELANKLQSDFITRIMDAHITYEAQKHAHSQPQTEQNNAYSITVTSVNNVDMEKSEENNVIVGDVQNETLQNVG